MVKKKKIQILMVGSSDIWEGELEAGIELDNSAAWWVFHSPNQPTVKIQVCSVRMVVETEVG